MDWTVLVNVLEGTAPFIVILILVYWGLKEKAEWASSVRAIITLMVGLTFCAMAFDQKIEAKDFMLIISLVFNFYFLVKKRDDSNKQDSAK